jgi:hypothetical protein
MKTRPAPVFILAPPRSYTSLACAMLGQHPQMYGLPELHLFSAEWMRGWWRMCSRGQWWRMHGALRAVAELYFGGQTEETIKEAQRWLIDRLHMRTGTVFDLLSQRVWPGIPVEKSPSIGYSMDRLKRVDRMCAGARYIHLLRHPRTQAESMLRFRKEAQARGEPVDSYWEDPPCGWYAIHSNICMFLGAIGERRSLRVRGEDLVKEPDRVLPSIFTWLGLRADCDAIEEAKHPERSPYASLGPAGARFGNDRNFLKNPRFDARSVEASNLDDAISWRVDGRGFSPRLKRLAREFGYE